MHRLSYKLLLLLTLLATIGGIITLLPRAAASYPNIVYYSSVCTFTPAATLYCFLIAGLSCFIRSTFIKDQSGTVSERVKRHSKSFIPLVLILAAALFFTFKYTQIKQVYTDGTTAASFEEN